MAARAFGPATINNGGVTLQVRQRVFSGPSGIGEGILRNFPAMAATASPLLSNVLLTVATGGFLAFGDNTITPLGGATRIIMVPVWNSWPPPSGVDFFLKGVTGDVGYQIGLQGWCLLSLAASNPFIFNVAGSSANYTANKCALVGFEF